MNTNDLAYEIFCRGLEYRTFKMIVLYEFDQTKISDLMIEIIENSNLNFLLSIISKKTLDKVKEMLIDYLYHREE